jgi:hypothetical protein
LEPVHELGMGGYGFSSGTAPEDLTELSDVTEMRETRNRAPAKKNTDFLNIARAAMLLPRVAQG